MANCTSEYGDHSQHFVIKKDVVVRFEASTTKTPKNLAVNYKGKSVNVKAIAPDNAESLIRRWTLDNEIFVAPDCNDSLTFRVTYTKHKKKGLRGFFKTRKDEIMEIDLEQNFIAQNLKEHNETKISVTKEFCTVSLELAKNDINGIIVNNTAEDPKSVLPESFQAIIDSCTNDTFLQGIKDLSNILENIPVTGDVLKAIEGALTTFAEVHPLAKAVLTALSIPYKLLKNESEFKQKVKDLADTMHFTCKCVVDVRYHTKIVSVKEQLTAIMETLQNAALYVNEYTEKGKIGQFATAQFPTKLQEFVDSLEKQQSRFQNAIIIQIAKDADESVSMTVDEFLRRYLRPAVYDDPSHGCLEGTRTKILGDIRSWLQGHGSKENILWLVGPPGAGKSTIATTIVEELATKSPFCANFSCKRDVAGLRNPRNIWPTLAYTLATKHNGVKIALVPIVNEMKDGLRKGPIFGQFQKIIMFPLNIDREWTSARSHRQAYPVVVIDALDECYTADDDNWDSLLDSLASWSELCKASEVKLIVTSRHRDDLSNKLERLSCVIRLTTGDGALAESKDDVRVFFEKKFADMRKKRSLDPDWPGEQSISKLTDYAAGLFIWADMVVNYVGQRAAGNDPKERLEVVLKDLEASTSQGIDGAAQVDRMYARILFEAFQQARSVELARAKSALATIVLAKKPLGFGGLVELLSTDTWDARNATNSTLQALSPIIPTDNVDGRLRVCHKTVSDFLLSPSRSKTAIEYVVKQWEKESSTEQAYDIVSCTLDPEGEEWNLALACMRLLCCKFAEDANTVEKLPKQSSESLDYAFDHWFEHLEGAVVGRKAPAVPTHLVNAMKVAYRSLKRYMGRLTRVKEDASALITSLQGAAALTIRWVAHEQPKDEEIQRKITECVKNLDIIRGKFQIAMIENLTSESSESFLQKRLHPSDQTVLDGPCMEGTRINILDRAREWVMNHNQPNLLWIFGAPGAGKSAVATSLVAEFSNGADRLCPKVFAKRDFEDRRDPMRIWRTLAYDMAKLHAGLKGSLMEALSEESRQPKNATEDVFRFRDITIKALEEQQCLSVVFLVDALDECFNEDDERWRALVETLASSVNLPRLFKLVVTSRDIPEIRGALESASSYISLNTESEDSIKAARSDMQLFLQRRFEEMPDDCQGARSYWTQTNVVRQLVENADSFIWAKMFVELVKLNPHSHVEDILNHSDLGSERDLGVQNGLAVPRQFWRRIAPGFLQATKSRTVTLTPTNVDLLYAKVLFDILGPLSEKERGIFRSVLAFVVFAKNPLQEGVLAELLQASPLGSLLSKDGRRVVNVVEELSSVISVGDNQLLRIPHKSFVDFLLDRDHDRCLSAMKQVLPADHNPRSFLVDRKEDGASITIACLQLMNNNLKFNVCGVVTSYALNDEIPGPDTRISESFKSSLNYVLRFWAGHLKDYSLDAQQFHEQLEPLLEKLLKENLLAWLEVLSLTKAVPSAEKSLQIVRDVLKGYGSDLTEVAEDALQFVKMFEDPITAAAPHIYLSALPFCPSDSKIARIYGPRYLNTLSVVKGRRMNWDTHATTSDAHIREVMGVAFFPDGRKLVSVSGDQTVRIWDFKTGQALSAPFTGHDGGVWSVAVSPDGSQIASGDSEGVLRIWDSNTGACPLGSINAHSGTIYSVAFSPDGSRIVIGSLDETVMVWYVATGDLCLGPLTGHTDDVKSVAFSIDGTVIASGSDDKTIRIWDARTGESRGGPLMGHTDWVRCVAFSADGRHLASGSTDETIRLWDIAQGFSPTCTVTVGSPVVSISFSPNSNCLVSGSGDGALRFWNVRSGTIEQIGEAIYGHTRWVRSVAFSPDGQSVASGSSDDSIKIWHVPSSSALLPAANADEEGNSSSVDFDPESLDSSGRPVLGDDAIIDEDGWMHSSRQDGAPRLFWVPEENRECIWWPRNTAVIHETVTKFNFRRFVHGEDWTKCRTSTDTEVV